MGRRKILGWLLLGLLALGSAAVIVIYRLRPRHVEAPLVASPALPDNAQQAAAGYSFTRSEGGHQVFTVRAQRATDLKNGQGTVLDGVLVEVFGRTGDQHDLVKAARCEYNSGTGSFSCAGQVGIELNAPRNASAPPPAPDASGVYPTLHGRQPVYLETQGLAFNQQTGMLTSTGHVDWRYGSATGAAMGLAYATREGWLELEHDVAAALPVQEPPGPGASRSESVMQLTAAHLRYAKDRRQVDLAGPVHMTDGGREADAGHALLDLDAQNRLRDARLDGSVSVADTSQGASRHAQAAALEVELDPATGNLTDLTATGDVHLESQPKPDAGVTRLVGDRVHVSFTGAHFHPSQGAASGHVHVISGSPVSERTRVEAAASRQSSASFRQENLDAADLEFGFRPANGTLDQARTVGPGQITLVSSDPRVGNRVVTAGQFLMAFDGDSRLQTVHGVGPTRIVFQPAPTAPRGAVAMESRADSLQANLDPASGGVQSMEQAGHFQFLDADRRATAARADYTADGDFLTLTGNPVVTDPGSLIRADRFLMHMATGTAEGSGHVSSTHIGALPGEENTGAAARSSKVPPVTGSEASEMTNVLAERITADRDRQYFHYEGQVRAWRGAYVVESPSLDIYRTEHRVLSGSGVVTSDLEPSPQNSPKQPPRASASGRKNSSSGRAVGGTRTPVSASPQSGATQPVTIRADRLEYFDLDRKAAYRGHVRLDSSGATLESDRLDAYFTPGGPGQVSQLEQATADGNVTLLEPGRRGSGDHAEYFATEGKVVMTGGPPTLYDSKQGFTTGRSLTFFTADDSLIVDGGSGFRSLSKHRSTQ